MSKNWFKSWFDSPYYHILYDNRDNSEARHFIDRLIDLLSPPFDSYLLDLACGAGRHSIYLNQKGYTVLGVDLSQKNIELARKHSCEKLSFEQHDMRDLNSENRFNYIFNLFTSIGYFNKEDDNLIVLNSIYKALKPGGVFVLDFLNANQVKSDLIRSEKITKRDVQFTIDRAIEGHTIVKKIQIEDQENSFDFEERVTAFTMIELVNMVKKTGFKINYRFGNYNLEPYSEIDSPRAILIASKN